MEKGKIQHVILGSSRHYFGSPANCAKVLKALQDAGNSSARIVDELPPEVLARMRRKNNSRI